MADGKWSFFACEVPMSEFIPLSSMRQGDLAIVQQIHIDPASRGRLMEMGLLTGTPVEFVRCAPLGDPVEIKVRGYHLTLRRHEADQIWVQR
jgi:ferrous iron transport protein A